MNKHYIKIFNPFSTDNGSEFSDFLRIIKSTKIQIYFCHTYCFGEKRKKRKKQNSMIRYFILKKTLIENYSFDDINKIANLMYNYQRRILN